MNPLLIISIPLVLLTIGMILNSFRLSFDHPAGSPEQDPTKRMAAEKRAYRDLFDFQRARSLKRQKRVGQYAWLVLVAFVVTFGWLYFDTVNKTAASNQISVIQTMRVEEGKEMVLSLTLRDGSNVKYLIKSEDASGAAPREALSKEPVSKWELSRIGTALNVGDNALPLGVALNISK